MAWTVSDMPDLSGKTIAVTGGNGGLGLEGARAFAARGAHLVLACRSIEKAEAARAGILTEHPGAKIEIRALDLASLASIRDFAEGFRRDHSRLDVLCNNAGVMAIPRRETADGFEMQMGTNHFGHFALTGLLLRVLLTTPGARVVHQSSNAHKFAAMSFDDLDGRRSYSKWTIYGRSKLANLLFAYELQRRLEKKRADVRSLACHPGYSATDLQSVGPRMEGSALMAQLMAIGNRLLAQDAATGALPMLYAATAAGLQGGEYIGPDGFGELWGHPKKCRSTAASYDRDAAERLWKISEERTGVRYDALN